MYSTILINDCKTEEELAFLEEMLVFNEVQGQAALIRHLDLVDCFLVQTEPCEEYLCPELMSGWIEQDIHNFLWEWAG